MTHSFRPSCSVRRAMNASLELAARGNERAFEAIVERYRQPLLRYAPRIVGDSRADDVAPAGARVGAGRRCSDGDEVRDLRPWLYRIVHNALAERHERVKRATTTTLLRDNARGPSAARPSSPSAARPCATRSADGQPARAAARRLARRRRRRPPHREVGRELGLTDGAVRKLIHRARTTLRAAAAAVTPWPLVHWLAAAERGSEPVASRVAELVAGGARPASSAELAKAGAVAVIAGSAVSAPVVVDELRDGGAGSRAAAAATRTADDRAAPGAPRRPPGRGGAGDVCRWRRGRPVRQRRRTAARAAGAAGAGAATTPSERRQRPAGRGRGRGRGGDDAAATGSGVERLVAGRRSAAAAAAATTTTAARAAGEVAAAAAAARAATTTRRAARDRLVGRRRRRQGPRARAGPRRRRRRRRPRARRPARPRARAAATRPTRAATTTRRRSTTRDRRRRLRTTLTRLGRRRRRAATLQWRRLARRRRRGRGERGRAGGRQLRLWRRRATTDRDGGLRRRGLGSAELRR